MDSGILTTKNYQDFIIKTESGGQIPFRGAAVAARALPGDKVVWFAEKSVCAMVQRSSHILVGTLELNSKTRYGMTSRGTPMFLFQPYDESYPPFYVASSEKDLTRPQIAVVRFETWELGSAAPRGVLARALLGPAGDLKTEKEGLLLHWSGAKGAARKIWETVLPAAAGMVAVRRHVSIDPPGCRDIDDAISVTQTLTGWEIVITIANVGRVVEANPWLAVAAAARGQTFYDEGRVVAPMLPEELSEGVCSLLEGEERAGISLFVSWNHMAKKTFRFAETVIRVNRNHTYESVMDDPEFRGDILTAFFNCRHDSHEWVEQAMILYNVEFARALSQAGGRGVFRRHSAPDQERLERFGCLGEDLKFLAYNSAEYCSASDPAGSAHWGLGQDLYCHASSPIRRFADLYNQMVFLGVAGAVPPLLEHVSEPIHATQPNFGIPNSSLELLNKQQKAAKAFERDCRFVEFVLGRDGNGVAEMEVFVLPRGGDDTVTGGEGRVEIWIPAWRQIIKQPAAMYEGCRPGEKIMARLYADPTKRSWRRRILLAPVGV